MNTRFFKGLVQLISNKLFWLILVLVIGLCYQFTIWTRTSGFMYYSLGNDEGLYMYLASALAGYIPGPPTFDFVAPGWPTVLAFIIRIVQPENFWAAGLFQRVLLGCYPALAYLILTSISKKERAYWLAAIFSLATLLLPVQVYDGWALTTDLMFNFLQLVIITVIVNMDRFSNELGGILLLSLLLFARTEVRLQGLVSAFLVIGLVFLFRIFSWKDIRSSVKKLSILAAPVIVGVLLLGVYNWRTVGTFGLSIGINHQSYFFVRSVGNPNVIVPDTQEMEIVQSLLPEVPNSRMPFSAYPGYLVAAYRAEEQLGMSRLEFVANYGNPATSQFIRANFWSYMLYGMKWISYDLVEFNFNPFSVYQAVYKNMPTYPLVRSVGSKLTEETSLEFKSLVDKIKTPSIQPAFGMSKQSASDYLNSPPPLLEFRFLYSGFAGLFFMVLIYFVLHKRLFALVLLAFYFSDLAIPAFYCGECISWSRFQYNLESASMIAVLIGLYSMIVLVGKRQLKEE